MITLFFDHFYRKGQRIQGRYGPLLLIILFFFEYQNRKITFLGVAQLLDLYGRRHHALSPVAFKIAIS